MSIPVPDLTLLEEITSPIEVDTTSSRPYFTRRIAPKIGDHIFAVARTLDTIAEDISKGGVLPEYAKTIAEAMNEYEPILKELLFVNLRPGTNHHLVQGVQKLRDESDGLAESYVTLERAFENYRAGDNMQPILNDIAVCKDHMLGIEIALGSLSIIYGALLP